MVREFLKQIETEPCVVGTSECNDKENLNAYAPFKELLVELNISSSSTKDHADKFKKFVKEAGTSWIELIPVIGTYAKIGVETYEAYKNSYDDKPEVKIESENDIFRVFENEFRRLAQENTVVVFMDDLQWADASSLNLIFGLGKAVRGNPFKILFIGSYRANEIKAGRNKVTETGEAVKVAHPFTDKLNMLRTYTKTENHVVANPNWFHEISLYPFARNEVDEFINSRFKNNDFNSDFFDIIFDVTDGHALFVMEIFNYLVSEGVISSSSAGFTVQGNASWKLPTSIDGVISEKVERLSAELQKVLAYASVNGEEFSFQIIEKILHMETEEQEDILEDYLEELSKIHGILAEDATTSIYDFFFTQSLVHKFVYAKMSNLKRKRLHGKIANILKDLYGDSFSRNQEMLEKYNLHNQIGMGLIDGVTRQINLDQINNVGTKESAILIEAAAVEIKKAESSFKLFAIDECLVYVNKALAFLNKIEEQNEEALSKKFEALFIKSEVLYGQGVYDQSLEVSSMLLEISDGLSDGKFKAKANLEMGKSLGALGRYDKVGEVVLDALEILEAAPKKDYIDISTAYNILANKSSQVGELNLALEYNFKSLKLIEQEKGVDSKRSISAYNNIGNAYVSGGNEKDGKKYFLKALEVFKKFENYNPVYLATIYNNLGHVHSSEGEFEEAQKFNLMALDIQLKHYEPDHPDLAITYNNIGFYYGNIGENDKALEHLSKSLEIQEKAFGMGNPKLAVSYFNIGFLYKRALRYQEALLMFENALQIQEKVYGLEHKKAQDCVDYIDWLNTEIRNENGSHVPNNGEAAPVQSHKSNSSQVERVSSNVSEANLDEAFQSGVSAYEDDQFTQALQYFEQALQIIQTYEVNDESISNMGLINYHIAQCNKRLDKYDIAITSFISAYNLFLKTEERDHEALARVCSYLGDTYYFKEDYLNAIENHTEALELYNEINGSMSEMSGWSNYDLGVDYYWNNEFELSVRHIKKALKIRIKNKGKEDEMVADYYAKLADSYQQLDNVSYAVSKLEKAYAIKEGLFGANSEKTDEMLYQLGKAYYYNGQNSQASECLFESLNFRKSFFGEDSREFEVAQNWVSQYIE